MIVEKVVFLHFRLSTTLFPICEDHRNYLVYNFVDLLMFLTTEKWKIAEFEAYFRVRAHRMILILVIEKLIFRTVK